MIPLRDRIADLLAHHPAFNFKDEGYSAEDVLTMADAVIRELGPLVRYWDKDFKEVALLPRVRRMGANG